MASINENTILEDLKMLAGKLGIDVRIERFYGNGGLCSVNKVKKIILNKDLPIEKQNEIIISELSKFNLDNVYLSPLLRKIMGADDADYNMTSYRELAEAEESVAVSQDTVSTNVSLVDESVLPPVTIK